MSDYEYRFFFSLRRVGIPRRNNARACEEMLLVVLAGFWGTIAASCAKFVIATSNAFPHRFACWILTGTALNDECHGWVSSFHSRRPEFLTVHQALSVSQWFWLFMVVAANVLQWISFMQGVHRCSSTSEAVVVCNCSGFFFTVSRTFSFFFFFSFLSFLRLQ